MKRFCTLLPPLFILASCVGGPAPLDQSARFFPFDNSRLLQVDGHLIHYREWPARGVSRGAMLLVHGLGGSTFSFREIAPRLARRGFDIVAVDLPGFGYSSRSDKTSFDSPFVTDMLWRIVGESSPTHRRWFLIGHSMGARSVLSMLERQPSRVRGIVLSNPALSTPRLRWFVGFPPGSWFLRRRLADRILTYEGVADLLRAAYGRGPTDAEIRGHLEPLLIDGTVEALSALVRNTRRKSFDLSSAPPTSLVLWGPDDTYVPADRAPELMKELDGGTLALIEGAAHCPLETHPFRALSAILGVIGSHDLE